jgi:hypothetical protein
VLRRSKSRADQRYLVLEVLKLDTFDKEINIAAGQGFRLMTSCASDNGARIQALMERAATPPDVFQYPTIFNVNNVVIMEKAPKAPELFEYRTIGAVKTSTFHPELKAAVDEGWKVVDTTYGHVLLKRPKVR